MTPAPRGASARLRHPVAGPVAVGLLIAALLSAVTWTAWRQTASTAQREAEARLRSNSAAAVRALARQSEDFKRAVDSWSNDAGVNAALTGSGRSAADATERRLATLAHAKDAPAVFVTDVRGRIVAIYPGQPELLGQDFSYRDWFRGVSRTGRPYVSEAYRSVANGHPLVVGVSAPVRSGLRVVGYVTGLWQLDSVRAVAEGAQRDDGVTISVTDQAGQVLTDELAVDDRGQATPVAVPDLVRQALNGQTVSAVRDGRLVSVRPVAGLGWTVQASVPRSEAVASAWSFQRSLLVSWAVAMVLLAGLTAVFAAVSLRRAREQDAAERERHRLAALFAASPVGIIEGLPDGTILAVNDAMAQMLGYRADELLRMPASELAHEDSEPAIAGALQRVLEGTVSSYTGERVYRARDGSAIPTLVSVIVLRETDGGLPRMVAFVVDQRSQKRAADQLRALAETLAEREQFLQALLDTMDVSVLACDVAGRPTLVNRQVRTMHGLAPDATVETLQELHLADPDGAPLRTQDYPLVRALRDGEVRDADLMVLPRDGRPPVRLVAHARRLTGPDGQVTGAVVAAHDVTALRESERALRVSEERFRRVFDEGVTGKVLGDAAGRVVRANATIAALVGRAPESLVGASLAALLDRDEDREQLDAVVAAGTGALHAELPLRAAGGRPVWGRVATAWLTDADGASFLLLDVEDVTARREAERRLTELALHDELTGLPNRRVLLERCEHAIATARTSRHGSSVAALFIDLDGFKAVNDRAGHEAGDELLREVAQDLRTTVRPSDTVARVGGDEFVVLVEQDEGLAFLRSIAERVGTSLRRQVVVGGQSLTVSASIGIARVDCALEPDVGAEQLLRRADAAMYRAKDQGRDRHDVFDADLRDRIEARRDLEHEVREALRAGRVRVVFQSVVDVDSGLVTGAETLIRISEAQGRDLPTLPAIVAAEGVGLTEVLGDRVLDLALTSAKTWPAHMTVAVNVSARELTGRDLRSRIEAALARHDFDPARLVLEITESAVLNAGPSALAELERLRSRGVRVAIDDFGTAYANLQNLTTLPVDALKVDASFTAGLPTQRVHTAVVHGVASMAYELDIPCVVEGVETVEQLTALRGMSVHAQGWLWGLPTAADQVPAVGVVDLSDR